MEAYTIILLLIAVIALLAIIYIHIYNNIQTNRSKIEKAEGLIDEHLRTKYDQIVKADEIIKSSSSKKKDYLKEYRDLKDQKISNFELYRKLIEAQTIIDTLCDDDSDLEQNDKMKEIRMEFKFINEKITASIVYYNKYTNNLNSIIKKFPSNIIAKIHHVTQKTFFDGKDLTDNDIFDFKL